MAIHRLINTNTASVERTSFPPTLTVSNDFPATSGEAIFHTGSMRVSNTIFAANQAGVEGPAVMGIGFLEELSNVSFSENTYYCRAREYGYIVKNEARKFCHTCNIERDSETSTTYVSVILSVD